VFIINNKDIKSNFKINKSWAGSYFYQKKLLTKITITITTNKGIIWTLKK